MPEEVLYILFIAMVAVIMVNAVCAMNHKKAEKDYKATAEIYRHLIYNHRIAFWLQMGAYEAPEKEELYLDLEGGLRLVIFEGKIEGWYKIS